jgi:DNA-3-methyladenine glycosylase I
MERCWWAGTDPMTAYHDQEWGVPAHDDRTLFEFLVLEGAQAGLSWSTILNKRENYRRAFDNFDPKIVGSYSEDKMRSLLDDEGIVRNRMKIASAVKNAHAFLEVQSEFGSFDAFVWGFVDGAPVQNRWTSPSDIPASTPLSDSVSRELKRRGFSFVGTTICYAFMQATGLVNDHLVPCFRHAEIAASV